MTGSTYGTGQSVGYTYDAFGNTSSTRYNGQKAFEWTADRGGNVVREKDLINNVQYDYTYDSTGRLVRKTAKDTTKAYNANSLWYNLEYGYDLNNNVTRLVYRMPQRSVINKYTYGADNLLTKFDINDGRSVTYNYDDLNRLRNISISTDNSIDIHYNYTTSKRSGYSTTKLYEEQIDDVEYRYEYDNVGNITKISEVQPDDSATPLYTYTYDKLNELTEVIDHTKYIKYSYTYNTGGNITREDITQCNSAFIPLSSTTIRYTYGDSNWKDKLTKFNGQSITYDEIGNPLTYRDGMTMTWKNGRQLATLKTDENNISYSYDSNSVRISKTVNGVKYTYAYINGLLMYETRGESKFYYSYDANGTLYSVKYTLTDSSDLMTYYFTHNSRGDIVGIYNGAGQLRAHYEYDAWGNVLSVTDQNGNAITSATHIGNLNPFRYRGYYLDSETGLYYLMSRYYDPVTHRFVNADGYFQADSNILDTNMFTYCRNNSIAYQDGTGYCAKAWAAGYQGPCPGQGLPGCMDNMPQFKSKNKSNTSTIDPNVPPDHPNYIPPKKGSNEKVKNPNGQGKGWPAKDGGVWIPTPNMHGGEGWTVQYPGGKHEHAYPGGHVRKATKESNPIGGTVLLLLGVAGTIYFVGNDVTGILIADDFCIPSTMGFIALGMDQIVGKYVCECGESWYGFG